MEPPGGGEPVLIPGNPEAQPMAEGPETWFPGSANTTMTSSVVSRTRRRNACRSARAGRDRVAVSWGRCRCRRPDPRQSPCRQRSGPTCGGLHCATGGDRLIGIGHLIAAPSRSARIWRYAGLWPRRRSGTRPSTAAPAAAKASRPKSRPRSTPSWAARPDPLTSCRCEALQTCPLHRARCPLAVVRVSRHQSAGRRIGAAAANVS